MNDNSICPFHLNREESKDLSREEKKLLKKEEGRREGVHSIIVSEKRGSFSVRP
jgi:hypothetical protein